MSRPDDWWEKQPSPTVKVDAVVTKTFPEAIRHRLEREVMAYQTLPWAAPKLMSVTATEMVIERCTPILLVERDPEHAVQLRALLERIHAAGWAHRDVSVANVVVHPDRGVLLIDWETSGPAGPVSYDLCGAAAAGFPAAELPPHQRPDGVWWGQDSPNAPGTYWKGAAGADL